jgi:hypothetical protein
MSKFYLIFILLILGSCSGNNGQVKSLEYDLIQIEFDGLKKDYFRKGNIHLTIKDEKNIEKLNILKTRNTKSIIFPNLKPVMFQIDLNFINTSENKKLLITINSSNNGEITNIIGNDYFVNNELFEYISELIKLKEIEEYQGDLNQMEYDKYIKN